MGESLLQGFPEAAPQKPTEDLIYADVSPFQYHYIHLSQSIFL